MSVAVVDSTFVNALETLVDGPLETIDDLWAAEWFLRVAILHDELQPVFLPMTSNFRSRWIELVSAVDPRILKAGFPPVHEDPVLTAAGRIFVSVFHENSKILENLPDDLKLSPALTDGVARATADALNVASIREQYREELLHQKFADYVRLVVWFLGRQGSVALAGPFGSHLFRARKNFLCHFLS